MDSVPNQQELSIIMVNQMIIVGVLVSSEVIAGRVVSSVDIQHPVDAATRYSLLAGRWFGSGITGE